MADVSCSSQPAFLMSSALALETGSHLQLEVAWKLWGSPCLGLVVFLAVLSHLPGQGNQSLAAPLSPFPAPPPASRLAFSNLVVGRHMWQFKDKWNLNEIKLKIKFFICISHT